MTSLYHPFSVNGSGVFLGVPIRWEVLPHMMAVVFMFRGHTFMISDQKLMQEGYAAVVTIVQQIEAGHKMTSPGIIGSNQLGGSFNGLSRQAAQTVSGNSSQALVGGGGTFTGYTSNAQVQYQNSAAAQLAAKQSTYSGYSGGNGQVPTNIWHQELAEPLKTEGFRCGEITAFRGWRVTERGFLRSMSANVVWGPGEPMDGKTKSSEEHCGVYAYKKLRDFLTTHSDDLDVYGQVALWGDVIEHELGYRAEFAKIISIENILGKNRTHGFSLPQLREIYKLQ